MIPEANYPSRAITRHFVTLLHKQVGLLLDNFTCKICRMKVAVFAIKNMTRLMQNNKGTHSPDVKQLQAVNTNLLLTMLPWQNHFHTSLEAS